MLVSAPAGQVEDVQMLKDGSGRFKGCAVVTYADHDSAVNALDTLNRKEIKGRRLVVKEVITELWTKVLYTQFSYCMH